MKKGWRTLNSIILTCRIGEITLRESDLCERGKEVEGAHRKGMINEIEYLQLRRGISRGTSGGAVYPNAMVGVPVTGIFSDKSLLAASSFLLIFI